MDARLNLLKDGQTVHNAFLVEVLRGLMMKIRYFEDTDTALIEFSEQSVHETKEINENIYIDIVADRHLVGMTIEHARTQAKIDELLFQQLPAETA